MTERPAHPPPTDRLQSQEGIEGISGRVFCWSHCGRPSTCLATPHGPTARVLAQEAEDDQLLPARVFAWFRHSLCTPACQDRAGPLLIAARSATI
jgi:hypothetical protein